jgi:hypothetical protein
MRLPEAGRRKSTMANRTGRSTQVLAVLGCALGAASFMAIPVSAGADSAISPSATTLVFANNDAHSVSDNVAVSVECLGEAHGFCSGVVSLSRAGHRISIPFSVRGGGHESLFVPLRLETGKSQPRKVHGVATTIQALGPPTSTKEFLYAE